MQQLLAVSSGQAETLRPNLSAPEPPPIDGDKSANTKTTGRAVTAAADNATFATKSSDFGNKKEEQRAKPEKTAKKLQGNVNV